MTTDNSRTTGDSPENRALGNVQRLIERNRQDLGSAARTVVEGEVRSVGILGGGMMGVAIAAANLKHGLTVVVCDTDPKTLERVPDRVAAELAQQTEGQEIDPVEVVRRLLSITTDARRIAARDLVLETILETVEAKRKAYTILEPSMTPGCVLASNTSTISIGRLAEELVDPVRFCGIHFFHPVRHRSLIEIIRGPSTSDETVARAVCYAKSIQKLPIVVDDGPGFLVNRLLVPYLNEALDMLLDGVTIEQIENAATRFGMAIGPLRILDEIGLNTVMLAGRVLWDAFPDRVSPSPLLVTMLKKGRLGRASGAGFFAYSAETSWDGPGRMDPAVQRIIADWAREPKEFDRAAITNRLLLPMVLEATRLLEEGKVRDPRDIDLAMVFGLGFPAKRGGLLYWADRLGPTRIVETLAELAWLGDRMRPTQLLQELAARNGRFYDWRPAPT